MSTHSLTQLTNLEQRLPEIARRHHRLALLVGPARSGKTPLLRELCRRRDFPYLNVNLTLSQRLLDLTTKERPLRVRRLLADVIGKNQGDVVALDSIELLFEPTLRQNPLACLQALSRDKTLIVAWSGTYDGSVLTYADPGHPEYRRYEHPDAAVFALL